MQSFVLVKAVKEGTLQGCIGTHGLAEFYSVLTRAPFTPRVHPAEAGRFLDDNILPYFELVALSSDDYKAVLRSCTNAGLIGGVVFDALHLHSALKAGCDRVYTFNLKDFRSLAPKELEGKIAAPYQSHKHKINHNHMEPNHLHAISPPLEPPPARGRMPS